MPDPLTWIVGLDAPPGCTGPRVAVKDAIDVAGAVTTAGCEAVARSAEPAARDAECLRGLRAAKAVLVGKTNLDELCLSASGRNDWLGTPINPAAPDRITGGSSSGSAVAVADGEVDFALGTDTGGSVRIPAACCGIAGLKTTWGRLPLTGVWPLAPSFDTVGPLAADVATIEAAMRLIDATWRDDVPAARTFGRLRVPGVHADTEAAVDAALGRAGIEARPVDVPGWAESFTAFDTILLAEFTARHGRLLDLPGVSRFAVDALRAGSRVTDRALAGARRARREWAAQLTGVFDGVDVVVLPTLVDAPPLVGERAGFPLTALTAPVNVAGLPALSVPVPGTDRAPVAASLQLVGPRDGEEMLCATAQLLR